MRRSSTALLFSLVALSLARAAVPSTDAAEEAARSILRRIDLHLRAPAGDPSPGRSGGNPLSRYAAAVTANPLRIESTAEFARRTLAGSPTARLTPEVTAAFLRQQAATIHSTTNPSAAEARSARDSDLQLIANLGLFHARRLEAAIHYNLFLRGLRIAELVAATYAEKDVVEQWRTIVKIAESVPVEVAPASDRSLRVLADWRAELIRLEASLRDLEEQCCPPDASVLQEKVWRPRTAAELTAPSVTAYLPEVTAEETLRFRARIQVSGGLLATALRVRTADTSGEFLSFAMSSGRDGVHAVDVPLSRIAGATRLEYFIEVIGANGVGSSLPAPDSTSPTLSFALPR